MIIPTIYQKKMYTLIVITLFASSLSLYAERERTIQKLTGANRSPFKIKFVREKEALAKKTELDRNVQLNTVDEGFRGNFDEIIAEAGSETKGTEVVLGSNIDDVNEEDIREYSVYLQDEKTNEWVDLGRVLAGISCNRAVLGAIPSNDYTNKDAVNKFDNFSGKPCDEGIYNRIEGHLLAHPNLKTSWGYYWLPKRGFVSLSDGTTIHYGLFAGLAFDFTKADFLVSLESIEKPKTGAKCTRNNRPGTLGADQVCHWISCTTASGLKGFKENDGDCTVEGCPLKGDIPGILDTDEQTCIPAAGLPCSTNTIPDGTTDASGNCVAKPGQDCIVENSHGSKGVTIAQGKCVGIAGGECMTPEGLGGEWSNDGKTCYIKTGAHCVTKDGKDGIMGENGKCNKKDGEACIDTTLSAEGIIQDGSCVATIGEECLAGNQIGTVEIENGARVCKMKTAQPGTGQPCIDSATHAKGFVDDTGKCIPEDGSLCNIEGQEGVIQNGVCSAKAAASITTARTSTAQTGRTTATSGRSRSVSTQRTRTRSSSRTRTR